jgi:centrosomal protein CEP19
MADVTDEGVALMQPKRYAIKFNPPRFILEYTDGTKIRIRSVRA